MRRRKPPEVEDGMGRDEKRGEGYQDALYLCAYIDTHIAGILPRHVYARRSRIHSDGRRDWHEAAIWEEREIEIVTASTCCAVPIGLMLGLLYSHRRELNVLDECAGSNDVLPIEASDSGRRSITRYLLRGVLSRFSYRFLGAQIFDRIFTGIRYLDP